ncbi:rRNA pseudouridine synthase [bacterium]|nr:rRNA pseudouridine synthase [bacterium]
MEKVRLNKILALSGIASRRNSDKLIEEGRVSLNGQICTTLGTTADPKKDFITVDGKPISKRPQKMVTYILNKPSGYICSSKRHGDDRLAIDLVRDRKARLYTIGRLDKSTEGLLLVTSEGDYANRVMHPSTGIEREYIAKTKEEVTPAHLEKIRKGTYIEGKKVVPVGVRKKKYKEIAITVMEGKKHEVRLLVARSGLSLSGLKRVRLGGLSLGNLPKGTHRVLSEREKLLVFEKKSSYKKDRRSKI